MFSLRKKIIIRTVTFFLLFIISTPFIVGADNAYLPLVQCGLDNSAGPTLYAHACNFDDFIALINRIINWVISIAGAIFTVSIVYGGFLYMTSGVNSGNKEKAKTVLWSTLKGFVIMLVAWLIVYTILNLFVADNEISNTIFKFIGGTRKL